MPKLLVAFDGSETALRGLRYAIGLAKSMHEASVHLVYAHEAAEVDGAVSIYVSHDEMAELQREHSETRVVLPFNPNHVTVVGTTLDSRAGDWVVDATTNKFTVVFGRLAAGKTRTGKVVVRVGANLAHATVLDVRPSYTWRDGAERNNVHGL